MKKWDNLKLKSSKSAKKCELKFCRLNELRWIFPKRYVRYVNTCKHREIKGFKFGQNRLKFIKIEISLLSQNLLNLYFFLFYIKFNVPAFIQRKDFPINFRNKQIIEFLKIVLKMKLLKFKSINSPSFAKPLIYTSFKYKKYVFIS